jgi:hypothetical protein
MEMTPTSRFSATPYSAEDPANLLPDATVAMNQWLSGRNLISDWLTNSQTELKTKVTLQKQVYSLTAHPLFMAVYPSVVGLETVGQEMTLHSRFWEKDRWELAIQTGASRDYNMEDLWDMLATEEGRPLCTEDTGEPLGVTVGGGVANQVVHHELVRGGWR